MTRHQSALRLLVLGAIVSAIVYLQSQKPTRRAPVPAIPVVPASNEPAARTPERAAVVPDDGKARRFPRAAEFVDPAGFLNASPFTLGSLIGRQVVLVDFWTYSCINCQRTIPYLNAWHERYGTKGLTIVGVHTPEFAFERVRENVQRAVEQFGIRYPVILDNDEGTWRAYRNRFWPHKYLIDIDGYVVYDHIGEGGYDETEGKIQGLLAERAQRLGTAIEMPYGSGAVTAPANPDDREGRSPEVYFGADRNELLSNGVGGRPGVQQLAVPATVRRDALILVGEWNFTGEYAEARSAGARILFRYRARDVHIVASAAHPARVRLTRDGAALASASGDDVVRTDRGEVVTINDERLYTLIRDPEGYGEHTLELTVDEPGIRFYTFTFG